MQERKPTCLRHIIQRRPPEGEGHEPGHRRDRPWLGRGRNVGVPVLWWGLEMGAKGSVAGVGSMVYPRLPRGG